MTLRQQLGLHARSNQECFDTLVVLLMMAWQGDK